MPLFLAKQCLRNPKPDHLRLQLLFDWQDKNTSGSSVVDLVLLLRKLVTTVLTAIILVVSH